MTIADMALVVKPDGTTVTTPATLVTHREWISLRTFIEYGTKWTLRVPSLEVELDMEAVAIDQELISVISTPAYWEGQVRVTGTYNGLAVAGKGFVEQYRGTQVQDFRRYLKNVSKAVLTGIHEALPMEPTWQQVRDLTLNADMESVLEGLQVDTFVNSIVKPIRSISDRQGKGWRSMALLVAGYAAGADPADLKLYISFPELLHTGSLIIDDIEDESELRRGGQCAHKAFGTATAINAGTAAYFLGEGITRDYPGLSDAERLRLYQLYFDCLRGAHVGQAMDIRGFEYMVPKAIEEKNFVPVWKALCCCHRLKSGLAAAICARTGAVLAHAPRHVEDAIGEYFMAIGLSFQIVDDVLNLRGFGNNLKTKAEDLLAGKVTAPVIKAFLLLTEAGDFEKRDWLWSQYGLSADKRDIGGMVSLIEECGSFKLCLEEAIQIVNDSWMLVDKALPDSYAKMCLRAFGWFVCQYRDY